jgi:hypothetical protein
LKHRRQQAVNQTRPGTVEQLSCQPRRPGKATGHNPTFRKPLMKKFLALLASAAVLALPLVSTPASAQQPAPAVAPAQKAEPAAKPAKAKKAKHVHKKHKAAKKAVAK